MRLGICAPIDTRPLLPLLDPGQPAPPPGLGGTPVVALVRAAVAAGWHVTVFTLDGAVAGEHIADGPRLRLCIGPFRSRHRARDLFGAERRYLAAAIARERPDVVHAHWTYEFALGALASGRPTLVTAHDRPWRVLRWDPSPYRLLRTLMAALVARRAPLLTAVSAPVAAHFERYLGCRRPVPVIPNGIEPEWFRAPAPAPAAGPFRFAAVLTGWGPLKNGTTLLRAFAALRTRHPAAALDLFGHGHGPGEAAARWARAHGLDAGVTFAGQIDRAALRARLAAAHALVHPSREESYSMAVAEAMAAGIPVIALRGSGGIADSLDDGRAALLVEDPAPAGFTAAMRRLLTEPALGPALAERAAAAIRRDHSAAAVLAAYARLYSTLEAPHHACAAYPQ